MGAVGNIRQLTVATKYRSFRTSLPSPFAPADSCFRKFLFLRSRDYSSPVNGRLPPRPRPTKRLANLYILLREKYDCSLGPFVDGGGEGRALAVAETSYERSVDPKDKDGEPPDLGKRQRRTVEKCLPYLMLWEYISLAPDDPGRHTQSFRRSAT